MATFWEPPALLSVATLIGVAGGALYYGLRPALRGPLPIVTSERDEVWGTDDPPPPPKRPYVYPADRRDSERGEESAAVAEAEPTHAEPMDPVLRPARDDAVSDAVSEAGTADEDEDEPSLADLFRARRRRPPPDGPTDATPKD